MTATKKLTKTVVDALRPAAKPFRIFDSEVKGFCVRVSTSGDKLWQLEYRPAPGGRGVPIKRLTLAAVGTLTPDEARAAAKAKLAEIAKGVDPVADRIGKRKELTIDGLIDIYEKEGCFVQSGIRIGQPMKPLTKAYTIARLRHHVVPLLGNKRVSEVAPVDIERMVRDIGAGKTARDEKVGLRRRVIVRGGEGAARKVVRDLSAVFTFAVFHKPPLASENPCKKARVNKVDGKRTRFLDLGEVQRLGKALEELEAEGVNPKALDITRLWALTGARRNEIAGLKWSEVDLKDGCLRLDDSKTGKSTRPLAASALMLLSALPRYGDSNSPDGLSPWVFPAATGTGHFQGTKRIWPKIMEKAGLPGVTPHVLRHSVGAAAVSAGQTLQMVGALLGHANPRSTAIYAHVDFSPAAKAANRAIAPIAAALASKKPGKVLPMKKAGMTSGKHAHG